MTNRAVFSMTSSKSMAKWLVFSIRDQIHLATPKSFFLFFFFSLPLSLSPSLFLHVCFNFCCVLSLPVSRNTYILFRFHAINNQIPHPDGSSDRCNWRTNLLFQTFANSQNCASQVYRLYLASESRCSARHSTYLALKTDSMQETKMANLKPDIRTIQL